MRQINKDSEIGAFVLALGAAFGFIFPMAAKWILLSFSAIGIFSWWRGGKKSQKL